MSVLPVSDIETSRSEPVAGGWPLLEVNTNEPVEIGAVLAFIYANWRS